MKTSRLVMHPRPEDPGNPTTRATERPLKICVVFDDDVSARSAEVLIKHVTSDFECDTRLFAFDELDTPGSGLAVARSASDTDILVVAVRDDRALPGHVQSWLGLYLGLRDQNREAELVVLITKAEGIADPDSSLTEYLETVAAIGGLSFFPRRRSVAHVFGSDYPPRTRRRPPRAGSNSNSRIRGLTHNRGTARLNNSRKGTRWDTG